MEKTEMVWKVVEGFIFRKWGVETMEINRREAGMSPSMR